MSLIVENEKFLETSLEDPAYFGWSFSLTNELGETQDDLTGQYRHINMIIDIESGTDLANEQASITVRISSVTIGNLAVSGAAKGWTGSVTDVNGNVFDFYVVEPMPDITMGLVVLKLGRLE